MEDETQAHDRADPRETRIKIFESDKRNIPIEQGWFFDFVWNEFSAKHVLKFLSDDRKSFDGHRRVTLAAFCAWILDPEAHRLRHDAIAIVAAKIFSKAEKYTLDDKFELHCVSLINKKKLSPFFFEEIYGPIGGIGTVANARSASEMVKSLEATQKSLKAALAIMQIHHWVLSRNDINLLPPSLEKSCDAVQSTGLAGTKRDSKKKWSRHKDSISIAYAASLMPASNGTLLDSLIDGKAKDLHHQSIRELICRSRFVLNNILRKSASNDAFSINRRNLPLGFPEQEFAAPEFKEEQIAQILETYTRKRKRDV